MYSELVKQDGKYFLCRENEKQSRPATRAQWKYLLSFGNVTTEISVSQFMKYISSAAASEAIDAAKAGETIVIE